MAEQSATIHLDDPKPERARSKFPFPVYALADCVAAAQAIYEKGGGAATNDQLAAYLGYKSANNGAFINRVSASKLFGLIEGPPTRLVLTPLAQKIILPVNPDIDPRQGLLNAFFRVPLYKALYDEYRSGELPPKFGMKNALRTMFGVTPARIDRAYSAFMSSADTAGLFSTRGSRTHLILPPLPQPPTPVDTDSDDGDGDERTVNRNGGGNGGGGNDDGKPPGEPLTKQQLQHQYIGTLIGALREQGAKGEMDGDLMARIEKLLELAE